MASFSNVPLHFSPPLDSFLIIDLFNNLVEFPHDAEHEDSCHDPQVQSTAWIYSQYHFNVLKLNLSVFFNYERILILKTYLYNPVLHHYCLHNHFYHCTKRFSECNCRSNIETDWLGIHFLLYSVISENSKIA